MKNSKAFGLDFHPLHYINMRNTFCTLITQISSWCLSNGYFPKIFKKANVGPILKPGKNAKSVSPHKHVELLR